MLLTKNENEVINLIFVMTKYLKGKSNFLSHHHGNLSIVKKR